MIALLFILLFIFCFIYVLNLYLLGAKKDIITFVFMILIIATVIISFFIDKWWIGLITIFSVFLFCGLARPLAQYIAFKILGFRTGVDDHSSDDSVNNFFKTMESGGDYNKAMKKLLANPVDNENKVRKLYNKKRIQSILNSYEISFDEYYKLFEELNISLHDIAFEIIGSSYDLKKLLELKRRNASESEIRNYFRTHLR